MARLPLLLAACLAAPALAAAHAAPDSFAPLVRKVEPAVVNIAVTEDTPAHDAAPQAYPALIGWSSSGRMTAIRSLSSTVITTPH